MRWVRESEVPSKFLRGPAKFHFVARVTVHATARTGSYRPYRKYDAFRAVCGVPIHHKVPPSWLERYEIAESLGSEGFLSASRITRRGTCLHRARNILPGAPYLTVARSFSHYRGDCRVPASVNSRPRKISERDGARGSARLMPPREDRRRGALES